MLGIHQGFAWSSTVIMKIDLVGEKNRGLAMGLNEFAGYVAVSIMAFFTAFIAEKFGIFPYPFYLGIAVAIIGLTLSLFFVNDTAAFVQAESALGTNQNIRLSNIFIATTITNRNLSSINQAGLINNLNDGMIWGLLPIILYQKHFTILDIGIITSIYPAVWGLSQIFTGKISDHISKKKLLFWGMLIQSIAIFYLINATLYFEMVLVAVFLGIGTALVYPTFLASISDNAHVLDRVKVLGIFRFWRDSGYAFGAIITGIVTDYLGISASIGIIAFLTLFSAIIIQFRMDSDKSPR